MTAVGVLTFTAYVLMFASFPALLVATAAESRLSESASRTWFFSIIGMFVLSIALFIAVQIMSGGAK